MKRYLTRTLPGFCLLLLAVAMSCGTQKQENNKPGNETESTPQEREDIAWELEERYWECVQHIDTVSYKKLWHTDFIGYPSFGDGVSNKSRIATWIPELHKDPGLTFSYKLYKKAVNAIEGVVIVFYDADEIWTNTAGVVVRRETYKFTHTWGRENGDWVILGGMAAKKNQDALNN